MSRKAFHDGLVRLVGLERPAAFRLVREAPPSLPALETPLPGEEECARALASSMSDYGRTIYRP